MPTFSTLESLQNSLEPLEALHGEHSQLESWVNESFQSLEKLHGELTDWQSELARKQTELDLREDALEKSRQGEPGIEGKVDPWKEKLVEAQQEIEQLEEENSQQLQELENLERRQAILETELKIATQRTEEIGEALESERAQASAERQRWREEFQQMRCLLEKHYDMLVSYMGEALPTTPGESSESPLALESTSRRAALRRRAQSRRAAKNRKSSDNEENTLS
ncbi:MAG: hypothetical protein MI725_12920 [Pirellulales bacterium]|nr:hypothetical protein [Pirellulales bacterium]